MPNELIIDKIARALLVKSYELDGMTEYLDESIPRRYHELAAAVLEVLRPMMWQDIESAPKDGTPVLVAAIDYSNMAVAGFDYGEWRDAGDIGWGGYMDVEPTHWMPLPDPPTLQTGER